MIKELIFKLFDSGGLIKVYHRGCGGHIGYVADTKKSKKDIDNFYLLDGSHPERIDAVCVYCGKCNKNIIRRSEMVLTQK